MGLNLIRNSEFSFSELDRDIIVRSFVRSRSVGRSVGMKSKVDQCLELLGSWFVQEVNWSTYACSYQHRDLLLKLSRFTGISASYKRVP